MHERIEIDPAIQHGRPVIRGTRVPVVAILGELAEGMSVDDIAAEHRVAREDVAAAIAYAGAMRFMMQYDPGHGDYTDERQEIFANLELEELLASVVRQESHSGDDD